MLVNKKPTKTRRPLDMDCFQNQLMPEKHTPDSEPVTQNPTYVDFMGLGLVRVARKVCGGWQYLSCQTVESGDSAFLGAPQLGEHKLELWLKPEVTLGGEVVPTPVFNKEFYTPKKQLEKRGDIRKTRGEFAPCEPWICDTEGAGVWKVHTQEFEVKSSYSTVDANERNLYMAFFGKGGIQTFAFSMFHDLAEGKGLYVTVEQVWSGALGRRGDQFVCPVLERQGGGSPALFKYVREHYEGRLNEVKFLPQEQEQKEKVPTAGLKAWDFMGGEMSESDDPSGAATLEVYVDMISAPRWFSMGRDKWGRQIYLNWPNLRLEDFPGTAIRRIPQGVIVTCKVRHETNTTPGKGKPIALWRGEDIHILSSDKNGERLKELAQQSLPWVEKRDWWDDIVGDDITVVETRSKSSPQIVKGGRRKRKLFVPPPEPKHIPMRFSVEAAFMAATTEN